MRHIWLKKLQTSISQPKGMCVHGQEYILSKLNRCSIQGQKSWHENSSKPAVDNIHPWDFELPVMGSTLRHANITARYTMQIIFFLLWPRLQRTKLAVYTWNLTGRNVKHGNKIFEFFNEINQDKYSKGAISLEKYRGELPSFLHLPPRIPIMVKLTKGQAKK